jgi:flavin reductase (DIM6/NTAB) family NADH-FMN oxidoreductase RutF
MFTITAEDINAMDKLVRVQFATSLPGAKPISLIGTIDKEGRTNLAPFSSVVHLGSNPALLGMISRPDLVERHTLSNILSTNHWTINHLHPGILDAAHQCSARYPRNVSEFSATGLTEEYHDGFPSPFVAESRFRIGMTLEQIIDITANGTQMIIGRVAVVQTSEPMQTDGSLDLSAMECLASAALDTYFTLQPEARLAYAKADRAPRRI